MNNPVPLSYRAVLLFTALFGFGAGAAAQNRIAFVNLSGQLVTVAPDGGEARVLTPPGRRYQFPAWSPTASELAVIGADAAGGGVFTVADRAGAEAEALYQDPSAGPIYLYWSPDGEKVGFLASGAGELGLEVATLENADLTEVTTGSPVYWQWTGDSERLLVHTGLGEDGEVAFYGAAGETGERFADPGFFNAPGLSPSEHYLAYAELTAAGARAVLQGNAPGTAEVRREVRYEGVAVLTWSPAADRLAIMSPPAAVGFPYGPVRLLDAATGDLTPLVDRSAVAFFWSPDGRHVAYLTPVQSGGPQAGRVLQQVGTPSRATTVQSPQLELRVVTVPTGDDRALTTFTPTPLFVAQFLPFFDQYALSHSVWAPDSSAVVLPMQGDAGPQIVVVPLQGESTVLGGGEMPFWSRR